MAARLLLIEDDASIARFVALALEELPGHDPAAPAVQLHLARSLAEARTALQAGGWQLVISDLMLPDGSAEALLADGLALAAGAPPWVVFSAGVHDDRRAALAARGVACTLRKPVPLGELLDLVAGLLRTGRATPPPPPATAADDPVHTHFGGDRTLYERFRAGCIERFAGDLAQGDAALAAADAATQVWAATSPDLAGQGGVHCEDCAVVGPAAVPGSVNDAAEAERLWQVSAELTGVDGWS